MNRSYIKIRSAQKRTPLHLVKLLQSVGSFSFSQPPLRTLFYGETDHDIGHQSRKEHREQRGGVHGHHNRTQALPPCLLLVFVFFFPFLFDRILFILRLILLNILFYIIMKSATSTSMEAAFATSVGTQVHLDGKNKSRPSLSLN